MGVEYYGIMYIRGSRLSLSKFELYIIENPSIFNGTSDLIFLNIQSHKSYFKHYQDRTFQKTYIIEAEKAADESEYQEILGPKLRELNLVIKLHLADEQSYIFLNY